MNEPRDIALADVAAERLRAELLAGGKSAEDADRLAGMLRQAILDKTANLPIPLRAIARCTPEN